MVFPGLNAVMQGSSNIWPATSYHSLLIHNTLTVSHSAIRPTETRHPSLNKPRNKHSPQKKKIHQWIQIKKNYMNPDNRRHFQDEVKSGNHRGQAEVKSGNHRGQAEVKSGNHRGLKWNQENKRGQAAEVVRKPQTAGRRRNDEHYFMKMKVNVKITSTKGMKQSRGSDIPFLLGLLVVQQKKYNRSTYLVDAPCGGRSWPWCYKCWCGRIRGWWWQESGAGRTRRWRRRRGRKLPAVGHVTTLSDHNSAVTNKKTNL